MTVGDFVTSKIQQLYSSGPLSRFGSQYAFDAIAWTIAIVLAEILRYEFAFSRIAWAPLLVLCVAACAVQLFFGSVFFLYRGRHPYGSFAEVRPVVFAVTVTAVIVGTPVPSLKSTARTGGHSTKSRASTGWLRCVLR